MQEFLPVLAACELFEGVETGDILTMLPCLQAEIRRCAKGEYVLRQGDEMTRLPLLISGLMMIQHEDYWGNRSIVQALVPGDVFGEAYAVPGGGRMQNDVLTAEDSLLMWLNVQKMLTVCASGCPFHSLVTQNLFRILAGKNRKLMQKISLLSQRSTREKLLTYLSDEAQRRGCSSFDISFNRQQLADFLSVDRSAMCAELSRMQRDGVIAYEKNRFTLL